jgi:hypothetical protein
MQRLSQVVEYLNQDEVVLTSLFFHGARNNASVNGILTRPLTTLFDASISGLIYMCAGSLVCAVLPSSWYFCIPTSVGLSAAHAIANWRPRRERKA